MYFEAPFTSDSCSIFLACECLTRLLPWVPLAAIPTTSGPLRVSHMEDRFSVGMLWLWHPRRLCLPLLHRIQIFEGRSSLPGIDERIATAVPAPFQMTVVRTPSLSWLRLHLSAHPLVMFLLAAISLPRVTSELAALTLLCKPRDT